MAEPADDPLRFVFGIPPDLAIVTLVSNPGRTTAEVQIVAEAMILWTCVLAPYAPKCVLPNDIEYGNTVIRAGSSFTLSFTDATQSGDSAQFGEVTFDGMVSSNNGPVQHLTVVVARWPLQGEA